MNIIKNILSFGRDSIYKEGIRLYNEHKFKESIRFFRKILAGKPLPTNLNYSLAQFYCAQAYRNLGISHFANGNAGQALPELKEALKLNPKHIDLYYFIGICENNLGNFKEAAEAFNKILKIDPDHIHTKLKLAITFHNMKMWEKTISIYQTILEKNPEYADVHFRLGLALLGNGNPEEAVLSFQKALDINPNYIDARIKLGMTQAYIGRRDDAINNLNMIIEKHPNYADVHYYLGITYSSGNHIDKGIQYFKRAFQINRNYLDARIKLAALYCKKNDFNSALSEIEEAKKIAPDNREVKVTLRGITMLKDSSKFSDMELSSEIDQLFGEKKPITDNILEFNRQLNITPSFSEMLSLIDIKDFSEENESLSEVLIPLVKEYIAQNQEYPDLHNSLGSLYCKLDMTDKAQKSFIKAVELNPDYIQARINLFKIYIKNVMLREASEQGEFLISKNIKYPDIFCSMGEIYFSLSEYEKALIAAQTALDIRPSYIHANYLKARIYEKQNELDKAKNELKICIKGKSNKKIESMAKDLLQQFEDRK